MQNVSTLLDLIFKDKENSIKFWFSLSNILQKDNNEIINFCNIIKDKINSGNQQDILLSLNLIDLAVDLDKIVLWEKIDSKNFISCLVNILKNNNDPDIQSICRYLIKKLRDKFKNYPSLKNCSNIFQNLQKSGINIPNSIKHSYINIPKNTNLNNHHLKNNGYDNIINNNNDNNNNKQNNNYNTQIKDLRKSRLPTNPENYLSIINLNQKNFHPKYQKFINNLIELAKKIGAVNILINNNINCKNNNKIQKLYDYLKKGWKQLIEIVDVQNFEDNNLMNICLCIIEDLNMTFQRAKKSMKGENPGEFLTSFTRDNNPYYNQKKININKTINLGENHKKKFDDINLGNTTKTIFLDDGENNNLKNSLNIMFGSIQKSEIKNSNEIQITNNKNNESMHVFNSMSQFSDNGEEINNNINNNNIRNLIGKNKYIFNNPNVMIIKNKIINNKGNINNNLNNNSLTNINNFGNKGSKDIYNNFLLNNQNFQPNKTSINSNMINKNMNINAYYNKINNNKINNKNNIYNANNFSNNRNNPKNRNNFNNPYNNENFLSKTQYVIKHANFNNLNK